MRQGVVHSKGQPRSPPQILSLRTREPGGGAVSGAGGIDLIRLRPPGDFDMCGDTARAQTALQGGQGMKPARVDDSRDAVYCAAARTTSGARPIGQACANPLL
jgi:hypothetical protein